MADESSVPPVPTRIYRWWDADGVLLYVGISLRVFDRVGEHIEESRWTAWATRMEIEPIAPASRAVALRMERDRIRREHPVFNRQGAVGWEDRQAQYYRLHGMEDRAPADVAEVIAEYEAAGNRYSGLGQAQTDIQISIDCCCPGDFRDGGAEGFDRVDLVCDLRERADSLGWSRAEVAYRCGVAEYMIPFGDDALDETVSVALMQKYARVLGMRLRIDMEEAISECDVIDPPECMGHDMYGRRCPVPPEMGASLCGIHDPDGPGASQYPEHMAVIMADPGVLKALAARRAARGTT